MRVFVVLAVILSAFGVAAPAFANTERLVVVYQPGLSVAERADVAATSGIDSTRRLGAANGARVERIGTDTPLQTLRELRDDPRVLSVDRDQQVRVEATNDPYWNSLYGLVKVKAPDVWSSTTGRGVLVAVVDTGINREHLDLAGRVWTNLRETPANGIDDDGNGYVDDVHGWNVLAPNAAPADDNGHGTHVAGTIAATADNSVGVVGVAPGAQLMAVKAFSANGTAWLSDIMSGLIYAAASGAQVVNGSFTGGGQSTYDAIFAQYPNTLFVVAAGNAAQSVDTTLVGPCASTMANVICVAATDQADQLASFSNYGATTVDLAAPGVSIYSTALTGGYQSMSGTSMATPHVAGAAALLAALAPTASPVQLRSWLLQNTAPLVSLYGRVASGGRLDVQRAVINGPLRAATTPPPGLVTAPVVATTGRVATPVVGATGTWTNNPTSYAYRWQADAGEGWSTIPAATAATYTPVIADAGLLLRLCVTATNSGGSTTACSNTTLVAPTPVQAPEIIGATQTGALLWASTGSWAGIDSLNYQWQLTTDGIWKDAANGQQDTFTLTDAMIGALVRVMVSGCRSGLCTDITVGGSMVQPRPEPAAEPAPVPTPVPTPQPMPLPTVEQPTITPPAVAQPVVVDPVTAARPLLSARLHLPARLRIGRYVDLYYQGTGVPRWQVRSFNRWKTFARGQQVYLPRRLRGHAIRVVVSDGGRVLVARSVVR